jgi:OOP family OmpA-OmpF porin
LTALGGSAVLALPVSAQQGPQSGQGAVLTLQRTVLDLERTVADTDGSVSQTQSSKEIKIRLSADVLFAFDSARLSSKARAAIHEAAQRLESAKPRHIEVIGYTDAKGAPAYNQRLSEKRGRSVARALRARLAGIAIEMTVTGRGASDPVAPNTRPDGSDNPLGRKLNRRVEIRFARP